jgi:hypothetical protein
MSRENCCEQHILAGQKMYNATVPVVPNLILLQTFKTCYILCVFSFINFLFRWDVTASVKEEPNLLLASEVASPELKVENFSAPLQIKVESEYFVASVDTAVEQLNRTRFTQASETDPQMSTL